METVSAIDFWENGKLVSFLLGIAFSLIFAVLFEFIFKGKVPKFPFLSKAFDEKLPEVPPEVIKPKSPVK